MKYPILTNEEMIIIHNRSHEEYYKFKEFEEDLRTRIREEILNSNCHTGSPLEKVPDSATYKSIIVFNEIAKYLNEKCDSPASD